MRTSTILLLSALLPVACGGDDQSTNPDTGPGRPAGGAAQAGSDHGERKPLGEVSLAGHRFSVDLLGDLEPGREGAFEVHLIEGPEGTDPADLDLYLWVEDEGDRQVSAPGRGSVEGDHLHFHATPKADAGRLQRIVLRLRQEGIDERAGLPLSGHGHEHTDAPHGGVAAAILSPDGTSVGNLELKLHDDEGDLELWLGRDAKLTEPFDLPVDAEVTVELVDLDGRQVALRARDRDRNADEEGKPNLRAGKTNYFVFPGGTGADSSFLQGEDFQSIAIVRFTADGTGYRSEELVLVPHAH